MGSRHSRGEGAPGWNRAIGDLPGRRAKILIPAVIAGLLGLFEAGSANAAKRGGSGATEPTSITEIQRRASYLTGTEVACRGRVTAVFPDLGGFYIRETDPALAADPWNGLFVRGSARKLAPGALVDLRGLVLEEEGRTLLDARGLEILEPAPEDDSAAPEPVLFTWRTRGGSPGLESWEGMLVELPGELAVCDSYNLARYGQLMLRPGGRPFSEGNTKSGEMPPSAPLRPGWSLLLDDGSRKQNPTPVPWLPEGGTIRCGDLLGGLVGVIDQGPREEDFVIHATLPPRIRAANPRPGFPQRISGAVRVAAFNVLNYFTTLDERGADDEKELARQQRKIVEALLALDADLLGLMEIENNGDVALAQLATVLNYESMRRGGERDWEPVPLPPEQAGGDAIRVALLYRGERLRVVGDGRSDTHEVFSRPPMAAIFETLGAGQQEPGCRFSVVVNHFKSKSCRDVPPEERDTGQGCWNRKRVRQTRELVAFAEDVLRAAEDPDVLLVGDFNACRGEDPIAELESAGYRELLERLPARDRYTYVYRGVACALDNALASPELVDQVAGVRVWHINADEPRVLDYNLEYRSEDLFRPDAYRSSDHDPVIVDLLLER